MIFFDTLGGTSKLQEFGCGFSSGDTWLTTSLSSLVKPVSWAIRPCHLPHGPDGTSLQRNGPTWSKGTVRDLKEFSQHGMCQESGKTGAIGSPKATTRARATTTTKATATEVNG